MTCKHRDKFGEMRVGQISRQTGEYVGDQCYRCRAWLPVGKANDRIPANEKRLACLLRDINILWEPGKSRDEAIAIAIDDCTTTPRGGG